MLALDTKNNAGCTVADKAVFTYDKGEDEEKIIPCEPPLNGSTIKENEDITIRENYQKLTMFI